MDNPELGMLALKRIESDPESFDMRWWAAVTDCGTVACLAGHVMLAAGYTLRGQSFIRPDGSYVPSEGQEATHLLGLSDEEQSHYPWSEDKRTQDEALALFRHFVETSMAE